MQGAILQAVVAWHAARQQAEAETAPAGAEGAERGTDAERRALGFLSESDPNPNPSLTLTQGVPFWTPPKRLPKPLTFDAKEPLHMQASSP